MSNGPSSTAPSADASALANSKPARVPLFSSDAWAPLKVELFRSLWIATSIAQVGTWMREAAGPWLMKLMTDGMQTQPSMIAKVTMFSNLPIFLFSVFAGALADVLDRRRLLIFTHLWMLAVSVLLGVLTLRHAISPGTLLGVTFLLGLGTAATGPALQAVLPELVPKKDFALAINLNSVALNVARAVGPALFILVVTIPGLGGYRGVGVSFLLSGLSFAAAVYVLLTWKRPAQRAALQGEAIWSGIRAGFLYTIHSPANRAILLRVAAFIIPALVLWSQVPVIATRQLSKDTAIQEIHRQQEAGEITPKQATDKLDQRQERVSALLFAFVGIGAIMGVLLMPGLHGRYRIDPVVNVCIACFAAGLITLSFVHVLWLAAPVLLFLGVNWVIIPTNFNTATQKSVPIWVKGRAISFYLTVLFGSFTVGSRLWGAVTTSSSIGTSLFLAGILMAALLSLAIWFPLTLNEGLDLTPAMATGGDAAALPLIAATTTDAPPIAPSSAPSNPSIGGVFVSVHYQVEPGNREAFVASMRELKRQRLQSGATRWSLAESGDGTAFTERFQFKSTAEQSRQSARLTKADVELQQRVLTMHAGTESPRIVIERVV